MLPPQGIVKRPYLLSFHKGRFSVSYAKEGRVEAPLLCIQRTGTALVMAATKQQGTIDLLYQSGFSLRRGA